MQYPLRSLLIAQVMLLAAINTAYAFNDKAQEYLSRGEVKMKSGHHKEAITEFSGAIESGKKLAPNDLASAYFNRGIAKRITGDSQGSKADLIKATEIKQTPKDAAAYYNRGAVKSAVGDRDGAIADFKRAAALGNAPARKWLTRNGINSSAQKEQDEANNYLSRGRSHLNSGNNKAAIADFTKAIELDLNYTPAYLATAYFNRGIAKRISGDIKGSKADFTKAIELDPMPKDAEAYCNRGTAKSAIRDNEGAISDFKKAATMGDITARKWLTDNRYNR
jgi:tetratricopeptide (TPR) repeat protein